LTPGNPWRKVNGRNDQEGDGVTKDYQRTRARVVRAGNDTAHLSIAAWCHGQITVPVLTQNVMAATGLDRRDLPGADLIVTANLAAVTDAEVDAHAFQIAMADDAWPAARRDALAAA
jgi:hypothetical protein